MQRRFVLAQAAQIDHGSVMWKHEHHHHTGNPASLPILDANRRQTVHFKSVFAFRKG